MSLSVTVTIPTHNRRDDLRRTALALQQLDPPPDEVIVTADGCEDDTEEMLKTEFPGFRLIVNRAGRGSVVARDRMIREATSDLILSLDDDSYPVERDFLARLGDVFEQRPRLAVATFPQRTDEFPETLGQKNFGDACFCGSFVNSAAAIRRSDYLDLPGYPASFFHAYEEPDFALQCVAAGKQVLFHPGLRIRHHYTTQTRSELRTHHCHARNEAWSVMLRCPMPWALLVAKFRAIRQLGYACKRGLSWMSNEPKWWFSFWKGLPCVLRQRRPVAWSVYRNWMRLLSRPISSEDEWARRFPPPEEGLHAQTGKSTKRRPIELADRRVQ